MSEQLAQRERPVSTDAPTSVCVVCSIDDSEQSKTAARVADGLARGLGGRLVLVHSAPAPRSIMYGVPVDPSEHEQERIKEAENVLSDVAAGCKAAEVASRVEFGPPPDVLMRVLADENADLLVLASRRHGSVRSLLSGSLAHKMIEISPCPVVVVPD